MINIALSGATGKMGEQFQKYINNDSRFSYVIGYAESIDTSKNITTDISHLFSKSNLIIDFSNPACTAEIIKYATNYNVPLLIGTTGLSKEILGQAKALSNTTPILITSNTSIGIALVKKIVCTLAQQLDENFDIEITESHHRHKVDAPSGTAITLGQSIAHAKNLNFSDIAIFNRHDQQAPRQKNQIGFNAIRGGSIIGEHSVHFISNEEEITITHKAFSRALFAKGALEAAAWLIHQKPGLYDMDHVFSRN